MTREHRGTRAWRPLRTCLFVSSSWWWCGNEGVTETQALVWGIRTVRSIPPSTAIHSPSVLRRSAWVRLGSLSRPARTSDNDDDDDDDDFSDKELVPVRRRRGSRDYYNNDDETTEADNDYYRRDRTDNDNEPSQGRYYDDDYEDDEYDVEFDEDDDDDKYDLFANEIIPNPLLDSIDPDGAADRFPELARDPRFWFDMVLFISFLNFLSDLGPRDPFPDIPLF